MKKNLNHSSWGVLFVLFVLIVWSFAACAHPTVAQSAAKRPNVLFIAIDDLRPALGCYGDATAITPNIDRLASRGTVFNRAYCQQALCNPSRVSLMTGRRPDTLRVWDLATHFREALPDIVTLPQHFKNHGYHTQSIGKIYQGSGDRSRDPPSWSAEPQYDFVVDAKVRYALPKNLTGKSSKRAAAESADVPDNTYVDGIVCDTAVKALAELQSKEQPFFLAVGFRKPHLPFCAPHKYWDLYDRAKISLPATTRHPRNAPELAIRRWLELEGYTDIPQDGMLSAEKTLELRHGYYACVSYVDALVGRLMHELENLKLTENTVIILWGDHGFHLGEQGLWTKANNYELSTRAPLILVVPGHLIPGATRGAGARTDALVEFVDVYPTLADVCGLDLPEGLEGISLKPLLFQPNRSWKRATFSQHPRARTDNRHRRHGEIMGYAIRTEHHRYVEWRDWETRNIVARELYDYRLDPNEDSSVVDEPDQAAVVQELSQLLSTGWQAALPSENDEAGEHGKPIEVDSESGAEIYVLGRDVRPADNIYGEQPYGDATGRRIAIRYYPLSDRPGGINVLDLEDGSNHEILSGGPPFPAFHAWGQWLYYPESVEDKNMLRRCNYLTLEVENVAELPPDRGKYSYGTVSPDYRYYAVGVQPAEDSPSQVHLLDLQTNQWSVLLDKPNFHAKHEQFSRDGRNRVLIQLNQMPDVKVVLLSELEIGGTENRFPADRPYTLRPTGHEAWIGETSSIFFSTGSGRDSKGNLWIGKVGDERPTLVFEDQDKHFGHISVSRDGKYWIADTDEPGIPIYIGSFASGRCRRVCISRTNYDGKQWSHAHPYLTADNKWLIFGALRSIHPQVHGAKLKDRWLETL